MKNIYLTTILLIIVISLSAQSYDRSVGVRLGYSRGIFYDKQNEDLSTNRYMVNMRDNGRQFTAMKIFRRYNLDELPKDLSFYYGYGAHAGYATWNQHFNNTTHGNYWDKATAPIFGLDAIVGISYDFTTLPISLTLDAKPFFDFWGRKIFKIAPYDVSIGAVYSF